MSVDFEEALKEACERQWREWLYGGGFVKAAKDEVPGVLEEIQRKKQEARKEVERMERKGKAIQRQSQRLKKRVRSTMVRGQALAPTWGSVAPPLDGLTPDEVRTVAEEMRRRAEFERNPMVQRIREILKERTVGKAGLICPECGDPDYNNRMNRIPWCVKCNVALMEPGQIGRWVSIRRSNSKALLRKLRGLPGEEVPK